MIYRDCSWNFKRFLKEETTELLLQEVLLDNLPEEGVEPSRRKAHGSKPCVSANSTTPAY